MPNELLALSRYTYNRLADRVENGEFFFARDGQHDTRYLLAVFASLLLALEDLLHSLLALPDLDELLGSDAELLQLSLRLQRHDLQAIRGDRIRQLEQRLRRQIVNVLCAAVRDVCARSRVSSSG